MLQWCRRIVNTGARLSAPRDLEAVEASLPRLVVEQKTDQRCTTFLRRPKQSATAHYYVYVEPLSGVG